MVGDFPQNRLMQKFCDCDDVFFLHGARLCSTSGHWHWILSLTAWQYNYHNRTRSYEQQQQNIELPRIMLIWLPPAESSVPDLEMIRVWNARYLSPGLTTGHWLVKKRHVRKCTKVPNSVKCSPDASGVQSALLPKTNSPLQEHTLLLSFVVM